MLISLHKQATTTPKVRAAIQGSDAPASVLAERYGVTEQPNFLASAREPFGRFSNTRFPLCCSVV
jgi:hypothetical protein